MKTEEDVYVYVCMNVSLFMKTADELATMTDRAKACDRKLEKIV